MKALKNSFCMRWKEQKRVQNKKQEMSHPAMPAILSVASLLNSTPGGFTRPSGTPTCRTAFMNCNMNTLWNYAERACFF